MLFRISLLLKILFLSTVLIGCNGGKMSDSIENSKQFPSIQDVPASSWAKLAKKKIYFGHQSVGNNILEGVKDLMKENSKINLNIVETSDLADFKMGLFAHFRVGKNHDPYSKIDSFASFIENGIGNKADVAFFKFCFVDIESSTDVKRLFDEYTNTMAHLKKEYPKTVFIHMTVPLLRKTKSSFKTRIKRLVGKKEGFFDDAHNIKRNEFNELLVREYDGKEPVFDLARVESTFADGRRSSFTEDGKTYYSLVPDYTHDGGHLNELGRKRVAEQLLVLLASLSQ